MADVFQLYSNNQANLFTIAESDWRTIDQRVETARSLTKIAAQVTKLLPNFHELLQVCVTWREKTFPSLMGLASQVMSTASAATTIYQMVANTVATLNPDQPLPDAARADIHALLGPLAETLTMLDGEVEAITEQVFEFVRVNQTTDKYLVEIIGRLGPEWSSIASEVDQVSQASGLVVGAWNAVASDLGALADGSIEMTTPFLLGLEFDVAIRAWQNVGTEAGSFLANTNARTLARKSPGFLLQERTQ